MTRAGILHIISGAITSIARTIDCVLMTDAGAKTAIQLEILTSKVETIPNPK